MEDLAGEKEVTVLIKYPIQTKESNKVFFEKKDQELTNLDWAKWAGWFDTDGFFGLEKTGLRLKDRQPVEMFSKIFETSLCYREYKTITPGPYGRKYIANIHAAELNGAKAVWFTKNIFPYLIKQEKKDYAARLLGYRPESKDFTTWTADELTYYLATFVEGDGSVRCRSLKKTKCLDARISSSDVQYLSDIKYVADDKLRITSTLKEVSTYKTKKGIQTKYCLSIGCSQTNPNNLSFFQSLVEDGVMTLDRKKQRVQEYVDYIS